MQNEIYNIHIFCKLRFEELKKSNPDLKILLTDFYPNIHAFERTKRLSSNFDFIQRSR